MSIKRVGIVGSGIMGSGIAETMAVHGFEVVLRSRAQSTAEGMVAAMEKSLARQVEKGKMADLVLWSPAFFGVKPDCIIKGGSHELR